jgi:two-component system cell cycle sensor histidine kinase/response regulator CckA
MLDFTMPHMSGADVFRNLRAVNKDVRVVMWSGYSEAEIEQQFIGKGLAGCIQKPFNTADLEDVLQSALC